jgi:hypothetical protein
MILKFLLNLKDLQFKKTRSKISNVHDVLKKEQSCYKKIKLDQKTIYNLKKNNRSNRLEKKEDRN